MRQPKGQEIIKGARGKVLHLIPAVGTVALSESFFHLLRLSFVANPTGSFSQRHLSNPLISHRQVLSLIFVGDYLLTFRSKMARGAPPIQPLQVDLKSTD